MKNIFSACAAFLLLALTSFSVTDLPIGSKLPMADKKMMDIDGKEVSMNDVMKKNGVLVMFSCNTCPYVVKNEQRTVSIALYALKMDVGVILINSNEAQRDDDDSYNAMQQYAKNLHYRWPYVVDKNSEVANAFNAKRTPEVFLFNKDKVLVYHGAIDDNPSNELAVTRQHLREAINEMVSGKEVGIKESKSIGCTIKRVKG